VAKLRREIDVAYLETEVIAAHRHIRRRTVAYVVLGALLASYLSYPYVTLYRLDRALEASDTRVVAELIDWPSVRTQLKADVTTSLATQAYGASGPEAIGAAFALALSPYVFDPVADRVISPSGLIAWHSDARRSGRSSTLWEATSYAFFRTPTRFLVTLRMNEPQYPNIEFEMRLKGLRWQVDHLVWPRARGIAGPGSGGSGPTTE
jgi:hypothetical protein